MSEPAHDADPDYWAEVEAAWDGRSRRPAPRRVGSVRGGVLAAVMLGLQEALEPHKRDEVVAEVDADAPTTPVDGVLLEFDPASPSRTVARLTSLRELPEPG